jgi:hypothetical protein
MSDGLSRLLANARRRLKGIQRGCGGCLLTVAEVDCSSAWNQLDVGCFKASVDAATAWRRLGTACANRSLLGSPGCSAPAVTPEPTKAVQRQDAAVL